MACFLGICSLLRLLVKQLILPEFQRCQPGVFIIFDDSALAYSILTPLHQQEIDEKTYIFVAS
jgi:hypothetical protein